MSRYIDADALEDNMFVLADKMTEHGQKVMDEAIGLTRAMPTADVQEVIHGHWDGGFHDYYCSVCGQGEYAKTHYCSNCGAKMDEEEKQ